MKILIIHNAYGKYSGEEAVVDRMYAMLTRHGHSVVKYSRSSEEIGTAITKKIYAFFSGIYSYKGVKEVREILKREKPDIVNIHNLYPLISPAALFECKKNGVPVVMTIHNFRLICPTGLFMRNGTTCELCRENMNEWGCIRYNCERSAFKSVGYALRNAYARWTGAYMKNVTHYACITAFQREKLISVGFDADRISVIPNFVDIKKREPYIEGKYVAYCGRFSPEKGVDLIIEVARRHPEIPFKMAGEVRDPEIISLIPKNVELVGYLSGDSLNEFYRKSAFIVMASRCYEGFPMSILEAAQHSKCTIGPAHGGFMEIIGKDENSIGALFKPGDVDDLEDKVVTFWKDKQRIKDLGLSASKKLEDEYSEEVIYNKWEKLLSRLVDENSYKKDAFL